MFSEFGQLEQRHHFSVRTLNFEMKWKQEYIQCAWKLFPRPVLANSSGSGSLDVVYSIESPQVDALQPEHANSSKIGVFPCLTNGKLREIIHKKVLEPDFGRAIFLRGPQHTTPTSNIRPRRASICQSRNIAREKNFHSAICIGSILSSKATSPSHQCNTKRTGA